jgi:hypothetical protein
MTMLKGFPNEPPNLTLFPRENKVVTLAKKFARGPYQPKRRPVAKPSSVLPDLMHPIIDINTNLRLKKPEPQIVTV